MNISIELTYNLATGGQPNLVSLRLIKICVESTYELMADSNIEPLSGIMKQLDIDFTYILTTGHEPDLVLSKQIDITIEFTFILAPGRQPD